MDLESPHNSYFKQIKKIHRLKKNQYNNKKELKFNLKYYLSRIKEPFFGSH